MDFELMWNDADKLMKSIEGTSTFSKAYRGDWEKVKQSLFPLFENTTDGRLWLKPEGIGVTEGDLSNVLSNELSKIINKMLANIKYSVLLQEDNVVGHLRETTKVLMSLFEPEEIASNKVNQHVDIRDISFKGGYVKVPFVRADLKNPMKVIPKGYKVSKYIKILLEQDDSFWNRSSLLNRTIFHNNQKLVIECMLDIYSKIVENLRVNEGVEICVSINPVDLLTASLATAGGWRSCFTITNGEYRTASLALLRDPYTIVAFAADRNKTTKEFGVELPLKVWRQLVFVSMGGKTNVQAHMGRHYPCDNKSYASMVRKLLGETICDVLKIKPYWKASAQKLLEGQETRWNGDCGGIDHEGEWHYADSWSEFMLIKGKTTYITVGNDTIPCVFCGEDRTRYREYDEDDGDYIEGGSPGEIACDRCIDEFYVSCHGCGKHSSTDALVESLRPEQTGEVLCRTCFDRHHTNCKDCGELYHTQSITSVAGEPYCQTCFQENFFTCDICGKFSEQDAHEVNGESICDGCFEEHVFGCDICGTNHLKTNAIETTTALVCKDCTQACYTCGTRLPTDEMAKDIVGWLCPDCYDEDIWIGVEDNDEEIAV